ncbi:HNH endonuclease [Paraburkholderia sp. Cpub6]|uniref:HNH endonuclease n=1 Tax=Paraburkholderia sp. Cpub6 TaxID=2723094 RepID=UPI0016145CA0|nr:HNH endonuclease signature motif containing protein [Paraburkholderia sp. Cpub6]MBB5458763.1 5-methylcytosine-specific restriction endonuclease McrA [Paraburkholderia sp. Cpub6]
MSLLTDGDNNEDRKRLSRLPGVQQDIFQNSLTAVTKILDFDRGELEAQIALLLSFRLIWRMIPRKLFEAVDPNYESLAFSALKAEFGADPDRIAVNQLSLIFRRLRFGYGSRKGVTSLDLSRPAHRRLFDSQMGRCPICGYTFQPGDIAASRDGDEVYAQEAYQPIDGELFLDVYFRSPVLDHIIPYYLGGDGPENWQILCRTCNGGKGEALSWILRRGWMPPSRISEIVKLTPSLRYAALSRYHLENSSCVIDDGETLRLFLRDTRKMVMLDNLDTRSS